ncbi:hypothetical protein TrVE_jg14203 [Triparma verrucosa]|uniref:Uncharacterized protein n=1 Tax=Triparma verrucosa TaxID=1606542 RepID=A0A9W7B6H7_9STRA|nr:hypothetical protein TrVE_jg14203 [Triparma verrucosa]
MQHDACCGLGTYKKSKFYKSSKTYFLLRLILFLLLLLLLPLLLFFIIGFKPHTYTYTLSPSKRISNVVTLPPPRSREIETHVECDGNVGEIVLEGKVVGSVGGYVGLAIMAGVFGGIWVLM